jgi:hypothetical protein
MSEWIKGSREVVREWDLRMHSCPNPGRLPSAFCLLLARSVRFTYEGVTKNSGF